MNKQALLTLLISASMTAPAFGQEYRFDSAASVAGAENLPIQALPFPQDQLPPAMMPPQAAPAGFNPGAGGQAQWQAQPNGAAFGGQQLQGSPAYAAQPLVHAYPQRGASELQGEVSAEERKPGKLGRMMGALGKGLVAGAESALPAAAMVGGAYMMSRSGYVPYVTPYGVGAAPVYATPFGMAAGVPFGAAVAPGAVFPGGAYPVNPYYAY